MSHKTPKHSLFTESVVYKIENNNQYNPDEHREEVITENRKSIALLYHDIKEHPKKCFMIHCDNPTYQDKILCKKHWDGNAI